MDRQLDSKQKKNLIYLCALSLLLAGLLIVEYSGWLDPEGGQEGVTKRHFAESLALSHADGKGERAAWLQQVIQSGYRLYPDRRFLLAMEEVHRFAGGQGDLKAQAVPKEKGWVIRLGDRDVGTVPDLADFPDLLTLLTQFAAQTAKESSFTLSRDPVAADAEIHSALEHYDVLTAAVHANQSWENGSKSEDMLALAALCMAMLAFQGLDLVETADMIPARALALLALTRALTEKQMLRAETLLASAMGYAAHAHKVAPGLPDSDPLKLFFGHNDEDLEKQAQGQAAGVETRFLHLMQLSRNGDSSQWMDRIEQYFKPGSEFSLLTVKTAVEMKRDRQKVLMPIVHKLLDEILGSTKRFGAAVVMPGQGPPGSGLASRLAQFESAVKSLTIEPDGPFLDSEILKANYRGYFYSVLLAVEQLQVDAHASVKSSEAFARDLGADIEGPASELQRWYRHLVQARKGHADLKILRLDLTSVTSFGAPLLLRTLKELKRHTNYGDPVLRDAAWKLWKRLDSRPGHREKAGRILHSDLLDLGRAEEFFKSASIVQHPENPAFEVWFAGYEGNSRELESLLKSPGLRAGNRILVLRSMQKTDGIKPGFFHKEYKALIDADPDAWSLRAEYANYLARLKEYQKAMEIIGQWLDHAETSGVPMGNDMTAARTLMAEMCLQAGAIEDGLRALGPEPEMGLFEAMWLHVLLTEKAGQKEEAMKVALDALPWYPDRVEARVLAAELFWRQGEHGEAARVLKAAPLPIMPAEWRLIAGPRFIESFKDDIEGGMKAAAALEAEGMGGIHTVGQLAVECDRSGLHELAYEILSKINSTGPAGLDTLTLAYASLKKWKGEEEALKWLAAKVADDMKGPLSVFAFSRGQYELLWVLSPERLEGDPGEDYWLMRTAAVLAEGGENQQKRQAIDEYYEKDTEGGRHHLYGRFLLGKATEGEMLKAATDDAGHCETSYYFGLKAQAEGRYTDAAYWYHLAVAIGSEKQREYHWAHDRLEAWMMKQKSLARMGEQAMEPQKEAEPDQQTEPKEETAHED
ncbi:MAG: hypothetical protein ABIJ56_16000 [Pseudomonadota bacterium]